MWQSMEVIDYHLWLEDEKPRLAGRNTTADFKVWSVERQELEALRNDFLGFSRFLDRNFGLQQVPGSRWVVGQCGLVLFGTLQQQQHYFAIDASDVACKLQDRANLTDFSWRKNCKNRKSSILSQQVLISLRRRIMAARRLRLLLARHRYLKPSELRLTSWGGSTC